MRFFARFFRAGLAASLAASLAAGLAAASTAVRAEAAPTADSRLTLAQNYSAPPADVGSPGGDESYGQAPQDSSSLLVRIDRLESQMRQLNGEIEQLQFQNHKLEDQLKKFQEDVDFRFQDSGRGGAPAPSAVKPQKRTDSIDGLAAPDDQTAATAPANPVAGAPNAPAHPAKRADAFDPASDPNAPGAPHPLGSAASASPPLRDGRAAAETEAPGPDTPLDLSGAKWRAAQGAQASPQGSPSQGTSAALATPGNSTVAALTTPNAAAAGGAPISPVKEEFDVAYGYYRQKEYETAEKSFAAFIQKNPKNKLTADATYYLGESFFQRSRPREAAEQYLKISTQYANSQHAPDAMLRLAQSLNALGAKEQACATFAEIARKYPNAAAGLKAEADREAKRVQC
jgi:tol-pal system protein YbgF